MIVVLKVEWRSFKRQGCHHEKPENRVICAVKTFNYDKYDAGSSCIRLAYKAFQMKQFRVGMGVTTLLNIYLCILPKRKA